MVQPITDPTLLAELEGASSPQPITDPTLLGELEGGVEGPLSWMGGIPEAGLTAVTGLGSMALGGYQGLYEGLKGLAQGEGLEESVSRATSAIEDITDRGTYEPRTEFGKKILEEAGEFGEAVGDVGAYYGGKTGEFFGPRGQMIGETIGRAAPDILGTVLPFTPGGKAMARQGYDAVSHSIPEPVKGAVRKPIDAAKEYLASRETKPLDLITSSNLVIDEVLGGNAATRVRWMESQMNDMQYFHFLHRNSNSRPNLNHYNINS